MPSGLNQILPRMRVTSDALRISALVVAGVTTGYFWRAAFEGSPSGPSRLGAGQHRRADTEAPGSLDGQTCCAEACPYSAGRPELGRRHLQPVTTFHRRGAVAGRPADSSAKADADSSAKPTPPPPVPAPRRPPAPAPQPGTPTPPVTTPTPTTPAPTTPASPAEGACRSRGSATGGRNPAAPSAASSHQGRRR